MRIFLEPQKLMSMLIETMAEPVGYHNISIKISKNCIFHVPASSVRVDFNRMDKTINSVLTQLGNYAFYPVENYEISVGIPAGYSLFSITGSLRFSNNNLKE